MHSKFSQERGDGKVNRPGGSFIIIGIIISIISTFLLLLFFIVSIAIKKPSFKDYHALALVSIFFGFIYLLSYGIIGLIKYLSNQLNINFMLVSSLVGGFIASILCIASLIKFNSWVLSNCILAFELLASLIVPVLNLLFRFYRQKSGNPSMSDYPLIDLNGDKYKKPLDTREDPIPDSPKYEEKKEIKEIKEIKEEDEDDKKETKEDVKEGIKRKQKEESEEESKEEEDDSGGSLIHKKEIEESITRELPAMHNPEIMKHMKVVGEQKVLWNKTHFIIGLESGGNS